MCSSDLEVLEGVEGVAICRFGDVDVVRHPLVQRLVQAYQRRDRQPQGHGARGARPQR